MLLDRQDSNAKQLVGSFMVNAVNTDIECHRDKAVRSEQRLFCGIDGIDHSVEQRDVCAPSTFLVSFDFDSNQRVQTGELLILAVDWQV
jgi:hypothetical protein